MVTTNRASSAPPRLNNGRDPDCPDDKQGAARAKADDDRVPYAVKRGDTLNEIAQAHDTTVEELLELNPSLRANPNALRVGQNVDVPAGDKIEDQPRARVDEETTRSSRQRAMSGEAAMRARVEGPYGSPAPALSAVEDGARIRRGMSGESVKEMQRRMNALGVNPPLEVDGKFGPKTEAALRDVQGALGIQQTGVLGKTTLEGMRGANPERTREQLRESSSSSSSGSGSTTNTSGGRPVDLGNVQTGSRAQRLGDLAEREARRMGTVGRCALGVNNALIASGLSNLRGHAYQKAEQLARDSDFHEVNVSRDQLANLPRGAVVVWGRSSAKPYGHVTVSLGNGMEASDHVQRMITGGRYGTDFGNGPDARGRQFRVFIPQG